jgi:hypothetical protein
VTAVIAPDVSADTIIPFPATPIVLDVIVNTGPLALAHTPVDPALISSVKHVARLDAVSPIRFRCSITVPPREILVALPNSAVPEKVTVARAY